MEIVLSDGTSIQVEHRELDGAFDAQGNVIDDAKVALSDMADRGAQILSEAVGEMKAKLSKSAPQEIEVSIGIAVGKKGSIVIASATAEAQLSIKAKWILGD